MWLYLDTLAYFLCVQCLKGSLVQAFMFINHNALIIVFLEMPLPIFRIVQEKTRVWWILKKIHHTPSKRRPQAKPFEEPHSIGSLRNVDKVLCKVFATNSCYRIIWPFLSFKQWRSKWWSTQTNSGLYGIILSQFPLLRSETDTVLWRLLTKEHC